MPFEKSTDSTTVFVPLDKWGKDHWSTFAYIETRIVDHGGSPNCEQMRCDADLHPQFRNSANGESKKKYPTKLVDGSELHSHDDWSCLDDAEAAGLIDNYGTGINRAYRLTEEGRKCANALRHHKADGGRFADFRWGEGVQECSAV
jgi:hypothetical protein